MEAKSALASDRPAEKASRKILVVEDNASIRELLQVHLRNAGYEVSAVADAVIAAQSLLENARTIDLMIVDGQLPYMSGIEFVSTLIADTTLPYIPIILITGHEHLAARAEILGVPCLVKPFSADTLVALVEKSIAHVPVESAGFRGGSENRLLQPGQGRA
jgi:CheY-like chemotaxis protein